jgi:hypothetical protein
MSLDWGSKKKLSYLSVFILMMLIGIFILIFPYLNKAPTCFDGKQNGDETGVDCGGSCARVCTNQAYGLVNIWSRAFWVNNSNYNVMALIENQNTEAGVPLISYEFRIYDDKNIFLGRRQGTTFINSNDRSVVFESGFDFGNRRPVRVDFQFTNQPTWIRIDRRQRDALSIDVKDRVLSNQFESPRLEAIVVNNTLTDIKELDVYAILYDENENVLNVSKTYIPELMRASEYKIIFTWPRAFEKSPTRIDIFPQVNVFELN